VVLKISKEIAFPKVGNPLLTPLSLQLLKCLLLLLSSLYRLLNLQLDLLVQVKIFLQFDLIKQGLICTKELMKLLNLIVAEVYSIIC
jgi:hypothetical protein